MTFLAGMADSGGSAAASSYGSGLIGGVLDAVIGPVMANVQYGRGKHVSNRQMKAVQFLAENQPSYAVEGLRRAGLNPLLSVMHGIAQPAQAARVDSPDIRTGSVSESMARGVSTAKQLSVLNSQVRLLDAQARESAAKADAAEVTATPKAWAEVSELLSRAGLYDESMKAKATEGPRNIQDMNLSKAREVTERYGFASAEAEAEFYKGLGEDAPMVRFILQILKGVRGR